MNTKAKTVSLKKFFLLFLLVSLAGFVFSANNAKADCYTNTKQIPAGSPPLYTVDGGWCTGSNETIFSNGGGFSSFSRQFSSGGHHLVEVNGVTRDCTFSEKLENGFSDFIGGAVLAFTVNSFATAFGRKGKVVDELPAAGAGAGLGFLTCKKTVASGDPVMAVRATEFRGNTTAGIVSGGQVHTVLVPSKCEIPGRGTITGLTEEECAPFAKAKAEAKEVVASSSTNSWNCFFHDDRSRGKHADSKKECDDWDGK